MSDDVLTNDSGHSLAKKRLSHDLKIFVLVQVVGLCVYWLSVFLLAAQMIPNYPAWDQVYSLCLVLVTVGHIVFLGAAFFGGYKLVSTTFLSLPIRLYAGSVLGLPLFRPFVFIMTIRFFATSTLAIVLCDLIFPFYCIIPQFFIARWLTKETEDGTMEPV